jgi:hypothetical protein
MQTLNVIKYYTYGINIRMDLSAVMICQKMKYKVEMLVKVLFITVTIIKLHPKQEIHS